MAQARRIKPKAKKPRKSRSTFKLPWGLMLVILASGVVLGMLFSGANYGGQEFGSGLKQLFKTNQKTAETKTPIVKATENKSSAKEFDFYELLPDIDKVMPQDLDEIQAVRAGDDNHYYLQAASFLNSNDAEKFRAELALKGFKSIIQSQLVEGKGRYYRVRLGPYENKRVAKTQKSKLQKEGIEPFVFSVKK